jgi:hypothetical protein
MTLVGCDKVIFGLQVGSPAPFKYFGARPSRIEYINTICPSYSNLFYLFFSLFLGGRGGVVS